MMAWVSTLRLKALHLQSLVSAMTVTLTGLIGLPGGFGGLGCTKLTQKPESAPLFMVVVRPDELGRGLELLSGKVWYGAVVTR